jgi:hypothetical protein
MDVEWVSLELKTGRAITIDKRVDKTISRINLGTRKITITYSRNSYRGEPYKRVVLISNLVSYECPV